MGLLLDDSTLETKFFDWWRAEWKNPDHERIVIKAIIPGTYLLDARCEQLEDEKSFTDNLLTYAVYVELDAIKLASWAGLLYAASKVLG